MRRFIRWLLSGDSNFFWTVAFLYSFSFFVISVYYSFRAPITHRAVISAVFLSFVITTVLVVFRVVFDTVKEHLKENMTLFEIAAFIEAKRRAEFEHVRIKEVSEDEIKQEKKLSGGRKFLRKIKESFSAWRQARKLKKDTASALTEVVTVVKGVEEKVDKVVDKVEKLEDKVSDIERKVEEIEVQKREPKLVVAGEQQVEAAAPLEKAEEERQAVSEELNDEQMTECRTEEQEKRDEQQIEAEQEEKVVSEEPHQQQVEVKEETEIKQEEAAAEAVPEAEVSEEVQAAADRIKTVFSSFFGFQRYPETFSVSVMSVKMLVDYAVSLFVKHGDVSSIGAAGIGNAVANTLAKVPLIVHTANVVSEANKIILENSFGFTENLKLLLAALFHDVGKIPEVWKQFSNVFEIRKHPEYSANFLSNLLESQYSNLFTENWRQDLVDIVYKHHSYYASGSLLDALKKADYLARKKESNLTDSSIQEYYRFVGGTFSADREKIKELIKDKFSVFIKEGFKNMGISFLYLPGKVSSFIGQKEKDGKFYLFMDPEFLIGIMMSKLSFCEFNPEWRELVSFFSEYIDILKAEKQKKIDKSEARTLKKNFKMFLKNSLAEFLDDDFPAGYSAPIAFLDTSEFVNKYLSGNKKLPVKSGSDGFYRVRALIFSMEKLQAAGLLDVSEVVEQIPSLKEEASQFYFGSVRNDMNELIYGVPSLEYRSEEL